jgi:hypothetical protein
MFSTQPIIEGYLLKKSVRGVPNWNKRYFRLLGNVLAYSHDNSTPHQKSKTIDLLHTTITQTYDLQALVVGSIYRFPITSYSFDYSKFSARMFLMEREYSKLGSLARRSSI